jgi:hypothetical protein
MAHSENLPAETTGDLDIPPDNIQTNKKPKEASWSTTPEENKQKTMEIPTWPLNHPLSSTRPDKLRSILRSFLRANKATRTLLINNNNKQLIANIITPSFVPPSFEPPPDCLRHKFRLDSSPEAPEAKSALQNFDLPRNAALGVEIEPPPAPSFVPPSFELPPDCLRPKFRFDLSSPKASKAKSFVPPSFELPPDHLRPNFRFDLLPPEASKAQSALRDFAVGLRLQLPPANFLRNEPAGVAIEPPFAPSFAPPPFELPPEHAAAKPPTAQPNQTTRALLPAMLTLGGLLLKAPFRVLNGFLSFPTPPPDFTRKRKRPPDPPKSTTHAPEEIDSENHIIS